MKIERIEYRYLMPKILKVNENDRGNIEWDTYDEDMVFTNEPKRTMSAMEDFWNIDIKGLFDENDSFEAETRICKPREWKECTTIREDNAVKLARQIDLNDSKHYAVVIPGNFVFGDFIENLITEYNIHTEELYVATLSMNETNVDSFEILLNGGFVDKLSLIVSTYFWGYERHKLMPYIYKKLDIDDRFQMAVGYVHMKTVCFKTLGGKYVVIQGSANLRSTGCVEQFTVDVDKDLYDLYVDVNKKILDKYFTINKRIQKRKDIDKLITN